MLLQGGRRRSAKQQAKATTTKKNMHKPIAFDVCSHNVSYTQCEQASQPRKWARYVHVLRIRHALKWLWQIIFLVNAFNMVINQALTHRETLEEPQTLTAVEWRQASHLVIESGNLNESAGNAIDMTIVITIDIDNGNGKAIIVVVLPRHKPHRHCHYSAAFAITPFLAWMSVCGLRTARSESTSCRLALASEYLNLILTFIMHTQEAHISVPLSISDCLSLCSIVTTNYLCDLISFPFCCCCFARHQAARFVSLYFRVWFACGWWKMFAADWLAVGSCRMCINQIKASPLSARENPEKPF